LRRPSRPRSRPSPAARPPSRAWLATSAEKGAGLPELRAEIARPALIAVIVGLGAGGLILFRHGRKTAHSLMASEARAQYAATHDHLTRLPNKAVLLDRLSGARADVAGVLCIGLDRYDEINGALGYDGADEVVTEVAGRLLAVCREKDTLARLSDDTFVLLWPGASQPKAQALAEQLLKLLAAPCAAAAGKALITCSIGMAFMSAELNDPREVLRQAQIALADARKFGRSHLRTFDPSMNQDLKARKAMEVELRQALSNGDLTMVYQPQVHANGAIFGVEALARWINAKSGSVPPAVFIPLAENCGLSRGHRGVRPAPSLSGFPALAGTEGGGEHIRRPGAFRPPDHDAQVAPGRDGRQSAPVRTGDHRGPAPGRLPGNLRHPGDHPASRLLPGAGRFRDRLFQPGLFAALSHRQDKIDRSFISHLGLQAESDAIVRAIVGLADALEIKVIAEGVETKRQLERLAVAGCTQIQGFYFGAPAQAEAIDEMLLGRSKQAA
jgi:diguanylate cyclase (GGDEF)-like protein